MRSPSWPSWSACCDEAGALTDFQRGLDFAGAIGHAIRPPTRMPGASASTMPQRTAPRLWWARTEESEVNRMVAIDVAMAIWTMWLSETCMAV